MTDVHIPGIGCGCRLCTRPLRSGPPLTLEQHSALNDRYAEERRIYRDRNPHVARDKLDGDALSIPPTITATALSIINATAGEFDVTAEAIFGAWPRDPEPDAARVAAITRLANEQLDGRPRYTMAQLQTWFGVSRPTINRYRARSSEYALRKTPKAKAKRKR